MDSALILRGYACNWLLTLLLCLVAIPAIAAETPTSFSLTPEEKAWLAEHREVRVGMMDAWAPFDFVDKRGVPSGIGVDYIAALNKRLDGVLQLVPGAWKEIYDGVKEKRLDALLDITPKPEREEYFNFTSPYLDVPHVIVAPKDTPFLTNEDDLKGKTLALEEGFGNVNYFRKNYPDVAIREYRDTSHALGAVARGEADAYAGNRGVALYLIAQEVMTNLKVHGRLRKSGSILAIGTRKDWPILAQILDRALADISPEETRQILNRWVGNGKKTGVAETWLQLTAAEQAWITQHPTVRIAFDANYPPYSLQNEQGEFVGIAVDFARELASRAGIQLEVYPDGQWKKLYAAAQARDVDVIATLVKRPGREEWFDFTRPYISLAQYVISRKEDMETFKQKDSLSGKTVALVEGYSMTEVVLEEIPGITPYYVSSLSEALESVSAGKADASIGAIGMSHYLISRERLPNLGFATLYSKGQSEQRFGIRKDWPELASILDKVLHSMSDQEMVSIFSRWTRADIASVEAELSAGRVELTVEERAWLQKHKTIRIGVDPAYPPFEFIDEAGRYRGMSADYLALIAKRLDVEFKVLQGLNWTEVVEGGKEKTLDLIPVMNPTEERRKFLNFSESYLFYPEVIITRTDDVSITSLDDLNGKTISVSKDYSDEEELKRRYPGINRLVVNNPLEELEAVATGKADATSGSLAVLGHLIQAHNLVNLKVAGPSAMEAGTMAMGVRSDWPEFIDILNKAFASITQQEKQAISSAWGVQMVEAAAIPKVQLTEEEQNWLDKHPVIRVASDPAWAPVEFIDDEGNYHGIGIDYLKRIEVLLGIQLEMAKGLDWGEGLAQLQDKQLDLVSSMVKTPQRETYALFTDSYLTMPINIFARSDVSYIGNLKALAGKRVAVVKDYAITGWLRDDHPDIQQVPVDSTEDGLRMVASGYAYAFVGNVVTTSYYIGKLRLGDVRVAGETNYDYRLSLAVRNDWQIFTGILQKALDAIEQSERDAIYNRWMSIRYEHGFDYTLLWQVLVGVAILFVLFAYWNRRLANEVRERMEAQQRLAEANERLKELDKLKSMFIASMSHELRTPLNSIIGFTGMMLQGVSGDLNEEQKDNLKRVFRSGQHLLDLITDVIDISKIEAGRVEMFPQHFALREVVDEAVELIQPQVDKKQLILEVVASSWPDMYSDRKRLMQCLLNYLSNAVKFTEMGTVTVLIQELNGDVEIAVSDSGIGIEEEDIPKLFEAFERLETHLRVKAGGTGLGLYLTKKITTDLLQGTVHVVSEVGKGSTFSIRIPKKVAIAEELEEMSIL